MTRFREDCPGCGRICTLTLEEKDDKYYLKGSSCNSGRHNAIKKWDFLDEENLTIEENKKKQSVITNIFKLTKLIFK